MKKIILLLLTSLFSFYSAQKIEGNWEGTLKTPSFELPLIIHIQKTDKGYQSSFDSPKQGAKGILFDKTTYINGTIRLEKTEMKIIYEGQLKNLKIIGNFQQNGMNIPLNLTPVTKKHTLHRPQTPKPPFDYNTKEVVIKNKQEGNLLAGTLVTPKHTTNKKFPIVVMITGSGAQDRNETLFGHQPFLVIADDLAKNGIGSLRLDDRGVGKSEKGKEGATTADFAGDISSAVDFLHTTGYQNIGLLGHSEGGMIAPMVTVKNKNVKFQVLLAAPGIKIKDLLLIQSEKIGLANGANLKQIQQNNALSNKIYNFVNAYKGKNLENDIQQFIQKELKDKMPKNRLDKLAKQQAKIIANPWFQYFLKFNPDDYLSKVQIPTLALNGNLDLQVTAKDNLAGIHKSLEKANNKNHKTLPLEGLNHLFQHAKTGSPNEYAEIEETIAPEVLILISEWIHGL